MHELSSSWGEAPMGRLPSLNGLRAFEAAARHLSFTLAAQELNVTQTAISHQIRRLEQELGLKLFERSGRSLTLTAAARDYLPGIRAAFQDLRLATDRLLSTGRSGVLTVSTLASFAAKWLLPRLASYQEQHPDVDVRITTSTALVDFRNDRVDAAIRYGRGRWPGVRATWLMADELFPVCSPALLKGPKALREPADLARATLLHTTGYEDDWRLWMTAAGLAIPANLRSGPSFDLSLMTVQAAIDGMGVAIGRTAFVRDDIEKGRLVAPFWISLPDDAGFYLVTPQNAPEHPALASFRDWLLATATGDGAPLSPPVSGSPARGARRRR
jgi:LysR family glycine cleavage system transcriptional activator